MKRHQRERGATPPDYFHTSASRRKAGIGTPATWCACAVGASMDWTMQHSAQYSTLLVP